MEETQEPAPPSAPPAVSNPAGVPVDLNNQEPDGKALDHFDQMMAGLSHFDNEWLASFLGHVQAYSEQQNAIAQEVAVSSCG